VRFGAILDKNVTTDHASFCALKKESNNIYSEIP